MSSYPQATFYMLSTVLYAVLAYICHVSTMVCLSTIKQKMTIFGH